MGKDRLLPILTILAITAIAAAFICETPHSRSTQIAAAGGVIALLGIVAIARPIWRIGVPVFDWLSLRIFQDIQADFSEEDPQYAKMNDPDEKLADDVYQQVFGPMFVAIGTAINGFSGFF